MNFVATFLTMLCVACGSDFAIPAPVPRPDGGDNNTEEQPDTTDDPKQEEPVEIKEGMLIADGNDEQTYNLILTSGYNYETPDLSGNHAETPLRHICQSYDKELRKWVFDFYLHILNDDDRGLPEIIDRQRNEIKTDSKSPSSMLAAEGETLRMTWKFRLPEGMQTTTNFSHIHQLKGIDNKEGTADVGLPLITFTARTLSNGKQQLQVIHTAPVEQDNAKTYLAKVDLSGFLGHWVAVTETVTFANEGRYELSIRRISDGVELVQVSPTELPMWRTGTTGLRPKWGLYRWFGENRSGASQLRDECLKFADFYIEKL